jgi:hypothetical protein
MAGPNKMSPTKLMLANPIEQLVAKIQKGITQIQAHFFGAEVVLLSGDAYRVWTAHSAGFKFKLGEKHNGYECSAPLKITRNTKSNKVTVIWNHFKVGTCIYFDQCEDQFIVPDSYKAATKPSPLLLAAGDPLAGLTLSLKN